MGRRGHQRREPVDRPYRKVGPGQHLELGLIGRTLRLALPVAGAAFAVMEGVDAATIKPDLDFMEKTGNMLSQIPGEETRDAPDHNGDLTRAEGESLRMFHALLQEIDPSRKWGGLRRVQDSSGDILWVCAEHYSYYDPGLPVLPYNTDPPEDCPD